MSLLRTPELIIYGANTSTPYTLTNAYVTSGSGVAVVDVRNAQQLFLEVAYTQGAAETGNSIEVKLDVADPLNQQRLNIPTASSTTEWYQPTTETASSGVVTLNLASYTFVATQTAGTYDNFKIDIPNGHTFIRVSVKETGVAANAGNCFVKVVEIEKEEIS